MAVGRPSSMEGRPIEPGAAGGDAGARRRFLIETDAEARFRDRLGKPD